MTYANQPKLTMLYMSTNENGLIRIGSALVGESDTGRSTISSIRMVNGLERYVRRVMRSKLKFIKKHNYIRYVLTEYDVTLFKKVIKNTSSIETTPGLLKLLDK